jgi:hypothetical protein
MGDGLFPKKRFQQRRQSNGTAMKTQALFPPADIGICSALTPSDPFRESGPDEFAPARLSSAKIFSPDRTNW